MNGFSKFLVGCVVLAIAGYVAWQVAYPSGTWRYKMTVQVETPEGVKTGSAVREVRVHREPKIFPEQAGGHAGVIGEAVVVDLGVRGRGFALMGGAQSLPFYVFPMPGKPPGAGGVTKAGIKYYQALKTGATDVPINFYPKFVYFRDPQDPKTVELVYQVSSNETRDDEGRLIRGIKIEDNFEEAFGQGVRLKSVTIEMTEEPITNVVKSVMPSYQNQGDYMKWFRSLPYGDERKIGPYDFTTGDKK